MIIERRTLLELTRTC